MKKILTLALAVMLLCLTACQAGEKTAAKLYLDSHSEQEITDYFAEVGLFYADFDEPQEIPAHNLFTFAMFHAKDSWYNADERLFYIPVADIRAILDDYLTDYDLPISWFEDTFAENFDADTQQAVESAIGMGTGCTAYAFISAEPVDADNVKVTLLQYCEAPEARDAGVNVYITARIVDGKAKFTSCHKVANE